MSDINEKLITNDLIFTVDINTVYQVNNISTSVVDNINKSGKKYFKEQNYGERPILQTLNPDYKYFKHNELLHKYSMLLIDYYTEYIIVSFTR